MSKLRRERKVLLTKKLRGETKNKVRDMAISEDSDNAIIKVY